MDSNFNYARARIHEAELMRAAAATRRPIRIRLLPRLRVRRSFWS